VRKQRQGKRPGRFLPSKRAWKTFDVNWVGRLVAIREKRRTGESGQLQNQRREAPPIEKKKRIKEYREPKAYICKR